MPEVVITRTDGKADSSDPVQREKIDTTYVVGSNGNIQVNRQSLTGNGSIGGFGTLSVR